jgi:hypothetical protein
MRIASVLIQSFQQWNAEDERSHGNRVAEALKRDAEEDTTTDESSKTITDPLAPVRFSLPLLL